MTSPSIRLRARAALSGGAFLAVLASAGAGLGAPTQAEIDQAQRLFDEGMTLLEQKSYAEACPRFAESQRLDPGMGTKYRLAECHEGAGRLGSALRLYLEVSAEAKAAGRADREGQASLRAGALKPRVPWLTINVPPEVSKLAGLQVKRDDELVASSELGAPLAVDPGPHVVVVTAPKRAAFRQSIQSVEGGTIVVTVPNLGAANGGAGSLSGQKIAAIVVGAVGLGAIGAGIGLGLLAGSRWDDALAGCDGEVVTQCSDAAIAEGAKAEKLANGSTVGFVVGGAAIVAAPILWLTAPSPTETGAASLRFIPSVGPEGAAIAIRGRF